MIAAGAARLGGDAASTNGTTFFRDELKTLGETVSLSTIVHGISFQPTAISGEVVVFQYRESDATVQVTITLNSSGQLKAYRGTSAGTLLETSVETLIAGNFYYIESKVFIDNATGTIEIKVWSSASSNETFIDFTGDTQNGGTGLISQISYGITGSSPTANWGDKYTCSTSGSAFNDFLGNKTIRLSMPNGAGNYTQWQPFPSAPNYGNVDDNPPDGGTSYNSAPSNDGDTDTFATENTSADSVDAVVVNLCMTSDGAEGASAVMRLSGTDAVTEQVIPTDDYLIYQFPFETDPTGGAWSVADFNSSEAGYSAQTSPTYWLLPYLSVYAPGTPIAVTANQVRVMRIFFPYNMLVSRVTIRISTTDVGNFWGTGLYTEDGDLFLDSGPISTDSLGPVGKAITPVVIPAGTYWYAWTSDSATAAVGTGTIDLQAATIREDGSGNWGAVANASIAGQLPATMGAFTPEAAAVDNIPLTGLH